MPLRTPLNRNLIVKTAIEFADQFGIDPLSMRSLGRQLNVEAMSLYKHVRNKEDLLDGMADSVIAEFGFPNRDVGWQESMRAIAGNIRTTLLRHKWAAGLVSSRIAPSEARFRRTDAILALFAQDGVSVELAYRAILMLDSFVFGFVFQEVSFPFEADQQHEIANALSLHSTMKNFPHLSHLLQTLATRQNREAIKPSEVNLESDFRFGVDLLLDGIETQRRNSTIMQ